MWIVGITGPLGAGKSFLTKRLSHEGVPFLSGDQEVHNLLAFNKDVQRKIRALWPQTIVLDKIDRGKLGDHVLSHPLALEQLEAILYPKLAKRIKKFITENQTRKSNIVVMDIPLLMEVGLDSYCSCVILVTAPRSIRQARVMKRSGMTVERFKAFSSQQMRDGERSRRADFIIYTGRDKVNTVKQLNEILHLLTLRPSPPWDGKWPNNFKKDKYGKGNRFRYRNNRF